MSKKLKLAFVVGGGVSLGSFSSSALTETLKQLLLYSQYNTGQKDAAGSPIMQPYETVEVDVLTGASAGAISLGVFLRTLVNHRDKYKLLGYDNYMLMREKMEQKLLMQHGEAAYNVKVNNLPKWESLVAVQTAQELQGKLWLEELSMNKLLGIGEYYKDMSQEAGLLNRSILEKLAGNYVQFEQVGNRLTYKAHLLAPRLLFCCTLSNMQTIYQRSHAGKGFLKALNDSAVDRIHSEKRVFDIHFQPLSSEAAAKLPLNWVQYQQGDDLLVEQQDYKGNRQAKFIKNLDKNEVWKEISATMLASGAFPMAFEPVVLNRYKYEYGENWPAELENVTKYPFTYMDGGLFNNEPVNEAKKLAAYLDSADSSFFDRQVIFIDPNVSELGGNMQLGFHDKLTTGKSLLSGKLSVVNKGTLGRLISKVPILVEAMLNEADNLANIDNNQLQQQLVWRKLQRNILFAQCKIELSNPLILENIAAIKLALQQYEQLKDLPYQALSIQKEIWRIAKEERLQVAEKLPMEEGLFMYKLNEFLFVPEPNKLENVSLWAYLLLCLNLDISLGLLGNIQHAVLVPIAPFNFYKNDYSLITLPGAGLAGFAGFASWHAGSYAVSYGKYCAYRILIELGYIANNAAVQILPSEFDYTLIDDKVKTEVETAIMKRVKELIPAGLATTLLPLINGSIQEKISELVAQNLIVGTAKNSFNLRIKLPNDLYVLRGFDKLGVAANNNNITAVKVGNDYFLVAKLEYNQQTGLFNGVNLNSFQLLYVDKIGIFSNSASVAIALPALTAEILRSANPIFIIDIAAEAKSSVYMEVKSERWVFYNDLQPMDEVLWGEDKIRNLYEKLN